MAIKLKEDYANSLKEKKVLAKNFSSLYKTAASEIKRKDEIIADLRRTYVYFYLRYFKCFSGS